MTTPSSKLAMDFQFCPYCGNKNRASAISCVRCGAVQPNAEAPTNALPDTARKRISESLRAGVSGTWAAVPRTRHASPSPRVVRASNQTHYIDAGSIEQELAAEQGARGMQGTVKLVIEQGLIIGEQYLLSDRETHIGRRDNDSNYCPDIELSAQDPNYVHRRHAKLTFDNAGKQLTIKDLGGRNGVFVNNRGLGQYGEATLQVGDKIRIGRVVLRLRDI